MEEELRTVGGDRPAGSDLEVRAEVLNERVDYPRAAVAVLIFRVDYPLRHQSILLLRKKPPRYQAGHWGVPGGKQELCERAADAAVRELIEETGLSRRTSDLSYQVTVEDIVPTIGKHYVTRVYATGYRAESDVVENRESDKHDLRWFSLDSLPEPLSDGFVAVLEGLAAQQDSIWYSCRFLVRGYLKRKEKGHGMEAAVPGGHHTG
jgi:8-oxo-dGTP diphosphatase